MTDLAIDSTESPFIEHRVHLDVYRMAIEAGLSDADYTAMVTDADDRIAQTAGVGFRTTPVQWLDTPLDRRVLAKVETANVGGSHKARHLFGLLLEMMIGEAVDGSTSARPAELAIASCGNAAVGAATVTAAVGRPLRVFVPADADPAVMAELERLDARVEVCERQPGVDGDPCMHGLARALEAGATAFTVQGPTCPGVIDGGRTLGLELAQQLADLDVVAADLYVQIGGGALATAAMDGLARFGAPMPRFHPVQPASAHPLIATWNRIEPRIAGGEQLADLIDEPGLMEPWPGIPQSIATGILDDITYDWQTVVEHLVASRGWPVLVDEGTFASAVELASSQVAPPPDATGAASLAGLLADRRRAEEPTTGDDVAVVLVTGVDRTWLAAHEPARQPAANERTTP